MQIILLKVTKITVLEIFSKLFIWFFLFFVKFVIVQKTIYVTDIKLKLEK